MWGPSCARPSRGVGLGRSFPLSISPLPPLRVTTRARRASSSVRTPGPDTSCTPTVLPVFQGQGGGSGPDPPTGVGWHYGTGRGRARGGLLLVSFSFSTVNGYGRNAHRFGSPYPPRAVEDPRTAPPPEGPPPCALANGPRGFEWTRARVWGVGGGAPVDFDVPPLHPPRSLGPLPLLGVEDMVDLCPSPAPSGVSLEFLRNLTPSAPNSRFDPRPFGT